MFVEEAEDAMETDDGLGANLVGLRDRIAKLEQNFSIVLRTSILLNLSVLKNLGVTINTDSDDLAKKLDDIIKSMV